MKSYWLPAIFSISFFLQGVIGSYEKRSLQPFFRAEPSLKITSFTLAKKSLKTIEEQELFELWESMLTGRSAPLSKWIKERYKSLGLNHIFTPSGFHLSAVIWPFTKLLKSKFKLFLLFSILGLALCFVSGFGALKRMVLIKSTQQLLGFHAGFLIALLLDVLWGSFQSSPLGFTYSFLFLGVIYSGKEKLNLFFWFFLAQSMLAYFQMVSISPLIIILNPILNMLFALALPLLFVLAFPLWNWQIYTGLKILKFLQWIVDLSSEIIGNLPTWEMHVGFLIIFIFLISKRWKLLGLAVFVFCGSLNLDNQKMSWSGKYEMVPGAKAKCRIKLIRGTWQENCSPRKGSRKA